MPREASISYEQVSAYSEAMLAEGTKPNPRLIRDRHGSGSLGTIHKLFQQWVGCQQPKIESPASLPPAVQRTVLDFIGRELEAARSDLEGRLAQAQVSIADLALENERQSAHIESLQDSIDDLQVRNADLEGRAKQLSTELSGARDETLRERQAAEGARTELAKALLRLEAMPRLEADLERLRQDYQLAEQRRLEVERQMAVSDSERKSIEQSRNELVKIAEDRLADAQAQVRQSAAKEKEARDALTRTSELLSVVQAARIEECAKSAERIGKLEGALAILEGRKTQMV